MGKRQISQLQTSELVVTLLISDLAVIPMQDSGQPLFSGLLPIFLLIVLEVTISFLMLRSQRLRHVLCGNPVVVIRDGKIMQHNMKALRMSIDDLMEQLRQKDVFTLKDVAYAIVETNGVLSVLRYAAAEPVRPADLKITPSDTTPDAAAVSDGEISETALAYAGRNTAWLHHILNQEKTPLHEVFLLTINRSGAYTLVRKEKKT